MYVQGIAQRPCTDRTAQTPQQGGVLQLLRSSGYELEAGIIFKLSTCTQSIHEVQGMRYINRTLTQYWSIHNSHGSVQEGVYTSQHKMLYVCSIYIQYSYHVCSRIKAILISGVVPFTLKLG